MGGERLQPHDVPTHLQTVGWAWSQEAIVNRNPGPVALFAEPPHIPLLATPPAWALSEGILCQPSENMTREQAIAHMNQWDAGETTSDQERAFKLCEHCPVRSRCLTTALEEEGDVGKQGRFMIRGGIIPRVRAEMAQNMREASRA